MIILDTAHRANHGGTPVQEISPCPGKWNSTARPHGKASSWQVRRTLNWIIVIGHYLSAERLVGKHAELFAKSPTDLGRTSLVCHKIDTGDARPVKQAPRRPPMAFAQEEQKIIKQQLDAGVIRESTSAWASPLVYVKKKTGRPDPVWIIGV